ncbi:MAG TPA: radical SAM protein [Bacteroidales bacterium]|nr:radical SAM protein [Bacteroidales bacterium]
MYDKFNRRINYLRISVTDRCNLRCRYCMPEKGVKLVRHESILSYDEIVDFTKFAVSRGIEKVRITGGEPLVRKGIVDLVRMISSIDGIKDLSMTTNGTLLSKFAKHLARAGLQRINISLDTVDPEKFRWISRGGDLQEALDGIEAAIKAGLTPIKINCVVKESSREPDAIAVTEYGVMKGLEVRYIRQMDLARGKFGIVEGGDGGNCSSCNRLRLTADGKVKPCLFSDIEFSVRELGPEIALIRALENKPVCGSYNNTGQFYNLGG